MWIDHHANHHGDSNGKSGHRRLEKGEGESCPHLHNTLCKFFECRAILFLKERNNRKGDRRIIELPQKNIIKVNILKILTLINLMFFKIFLYFHVP